MNDGPQHSLGFPELPVSRLRPAWPPRLPPAQACRRPIATVPARIDDGVAGHARAAAPPRARHARPDADARILACLRPAEIVTVHDIVARTGLSRSHTHSRVRVLLQSGALQRAGATSHNAPDRLQRPAQP